LITVLAGQFIMMIFEQFLSIS